MAGNKRVLDRPTATHRGGQLTLWRLLVACLAAAAVAAPIFAFSGGSFGLQLDVIDDAGGLGVLVAAVAASLAVPISLRATGLRNASTARTVSVALAVDVYAVGWGLRLPVAEALRAELSPLHGVLASAASLPQESWLVVAAAFTIAVAAALAFTDLLFAGRLCRQCGARCRPVGDTVECAAPPLEEVEARLRARDWSFFRPLGPPSRRGHGLRFRLYSCGCGRTNCFDLIVLKRFGRNRPIARLEPLPAKDMRELRKVTYDILHPARAADWLVPTEARVHRAVTAQRRIDSERERLFRLTSGDPSWRIGVEDVRRRRAAPARAPRASGTPAPALYARSWSLLH